MPPLQFAAVGVGVLLDLLGKRQKELLQLLLKTKPGLTVDELAQSLSITRNAVRQHLSALENDGLVLQGPTRPSGGRPQQLYVLTPKGRELFPRQYSWLAQLLLDAVKKEAGVTGMRDRMAQMGTAMAGQLRAQHPGLNSRREKVVKLSELMQQLGYSARTPGSTASTIEADNCVFHELAFSTPEVCEFDRALLSGFTDSKVDHEECMARGGHVCCFKFKPKS